MRINCLGDVVAARESGAATHKKSGQESPCYRVHPNESGCTSR